MTMGRKRTTRMGTAPTIPTGSPPGTREGSSAAAELWTTGTVKNTSTASASGTREEGVASRTPSSSDSRVDYR